MTQHFSFFLSHYVQHKESVSAARKGVADRLHQYGADDQYLSQISTGTNQNYISGDMVTADAGYIDPLCTVHCERYIICLSVLFFFFFYNNLTEYTIFSSVLYFIYEIKRSPVYLHIQLHIYNSKIHINYQNV